MIWLSGIDENWSKCEKVRILIRTDSHLGIRMVAEELNMDKEMVRKILTTNLNIKNVCVKMVTKDMPVFSQKTNTKARTHTVLNRSCPM
jgi:hypothetical protein